jgi:glycosyltransferase involved in cell wall biosynthesis
VRGAIDVVRAGFGELPERMARADVALNPRTDCDGLPQKLLNYMAAALPVVSFRSAAPGLRDGDTALLVEDGDVKAFAAAALRVLGDPALGERLGASAQAFVSRARSWEHAAEQTERVYRRVLGR